MNRLPPPPGYFEVQIQPGHIAATIDEMRQMQSPGYINYVVPDLLYVDHHDILRVSAGDYPLATTPAQVDALIRHLQEVKQRMVDGGL